MNSAISKYDFFNDDNKALFWYVTILLGVGLVMVTSASFDLITDKAFEYTLKKLIYIILSLILAVFICRIPASKVFYRGGSLFFISITLLLLVFLPIIGKEVKGSHRWLDFQLLTVQPVEFVKIFMIIFAANYIARHYTQMSSSLWEPSKLVGLGAIIAILLAVQPDYGTAIVVLMIIFGMLFLSPMCLKHFFLSIFICGLILSLGMMLASYRVERILAFMNPWQDRYDTGFQLVESLIAIKNGGWFGAGLGNSIQKLSYLPEARSDFILAIIAEELGVIGICLLILLFCLLTQCCFSIAQRAQKQGFLNYTFYAYGVGIWIFVQFIINAGVVLGCLPTKGITLPFVSAGGSSLMALVLAIALLMRINYEISIPESQLKSRIGYGC